jgi:hypothetical protein
MLFNLLQVETPTLPCLGVICCEKLSLAKRKTLKLEGKMKDFQATKKSTK